MVSNALSKRRGPLRRPKVCRTAKNPGRCEPPPPPVTCVCTMDPVEQTIWIWEQGGVLLHYCRDLSPPNLDVTLEYFSVGSDLGGPLAGTDCIDSVATYVPHAPGVWDISVRFTFYDGFQCTVSGQVTVLSPW